MVKEVHKEPPKEVHKEVPKVIESPEESEEEEESEEGEESEEEEEDVPRGNNQLVLFPWNFQFLLHIKTTN